jgi:hypothetical protein
MPGGAMSITDHLNTYSVAGIDGVLYRGYNTALVTTFYMLWLERLASTQRALMDIALAELVAHGSAVAPDYAKPIKSARPRTEGKPIMYELRHPDHPGYALRAFAVLLPITSPNVLVISGGDKHNDPDFYDNRVPTVDRFIDAYLAEGN